MRRGVPSGRLSRAAARVAGALVAAGVAACGLFGPGERGGTPAARLDAAFAEAARLPNLTSLVAIHDGSVERQLYLNGGAADSAQDVRSITKSIVSLVVGIALDRGCLQSLDRTLADLGPLAPADTAKRRITLGQLLNMTSGMGGDELTNVDLYNQWALAPDPLAYVWDLPLVAAPGTHFYYYSPNFYVAARIVTQACGQETAAYARDVLFAPLGIGFRTWEADDKGYANGGAGLRLTPADMAAIGGLVLDSGRAGTAQVVSSAWIRAATTATVATADEPYVTGYGFGWWIGQAGGVRFVMAMGWGGQFIVIVPSKRLIVTATNRWQGLARDVTSAQWLATYDLILQRIVPAF